jgi:hypothetical protein
MPLTGKNDVVSGSGGGRTMRGLGFLAVVAMATVACGSAPTPSQRPFAEYWVYQTPETEISLDLVASGSTLAGNLNFLEAVTMPQLVTQGLQSATNHFYDANGNPLAQGCPASDTCALDQQLAVRGQRNGSRVELDFSGFNGAVCVFAIDGNYLDGNQGAPCDAHAQASGGPKINQGLRFAGTTAAGVASAHKAFFHTFKETAQAWDLESLPSQLSVQTYGPGLILDNDIQGLDAAASQFGVSNDTVCGDVNDYNALPRSIAQINEEASQIATSIKAAQAKIAAFQAGAKTDKALDWYVKNTTVIADANAAVDQIVQQVDADVKRGNADLDKFRQKPPTQADTVQCGLQDFAIETLAHLAFEAAI